MLDIVVSIWNERTWGECRILRRRKVLKNNLGSLCFYKFKYNIYQGLFRTLFHELQILELFHLVHRYIAEKDPLWSHRKTRACSRLFLEVCEAIAIVLEPQILYSGFLWEGKIGFLVYFGYLEYIQTFHSTEMSKRFLNNFKHQKRSSWRTQHTTDYLNHF